MASADPLQQRVLHRILRVALRLMFRGATVLPVPERIQRRWIEWISVVARSAPGTVMQPGQWDRVRGAAFACAAAPAPDTAVLYLHGGGYTLGSHRTHAALASHLARAGSTTVVVPDYRLAPEHPYPAALEDALKVYGALLDTYDASRLAIAGDSAGGGLALSLVVALRAAGLPLPAALVLISPWTDLTLDGGTHQTLRSRDPMLSARWLRRAADGYRGELSLTDARISPLLADLRGLPPTLVQVGGDEILLDDARRLAERAWAVGVDLRMEIEPGMWHDFQLQAALLQRAAAAVTRIGRFLRHHWTTEPMTPVSTHPRSAA